MAYKRSYVFTSACGGLLTLLAGIFLISYLISSAVDIFVDPVFAKQSECLYQSYWHNQERAWKLNASQYNIPMLIQSRDKSINHTEYVRV